jgi:secreted trypsin-like serine protease
MMVNYPGIGPYQWCSGTLVHSQIFLTAGHCVDGLASYGIDRVWVTFGQDANLGTLLDVDQVIPHPDYYWGPTSNPHDIAVLVLTDPVPDTGITPANLPSEGFLDDLKDEGLLHRGSFRAKFTLVGYGGSLEWPPPFIFYEDERQFAESEFRALLKKWLRMSQNQATGDGGTCYGDSGGPAFWTAEDGTETLVGVTSWGDAQCVASAFNYRVDIPETLDFIADVVAGLN